MKNFDYIKKKAVEQFSDFISNAELNSEQEDFLSTVINYVCENGDITREIDINKIHTVIIPQTA